MSTSRSDRGGLRLGLEYEPDDNGGPLNNPGIIPRGLTGSVRPIRGEFAEIAAHRPRNLFTGSEPDRELQNCSYALRITRPNSAELRAAASRPSMLSDSLHFIGFHQRHVNYLPGIYRRKALLLSISH